MAMYNGDGLLNNFQTIKRTRFPRWNETIEMEIGKDTSEEELIHVTVWDWDRIGSDDFMGQVRNL